MAKYVEYACFWRFKNDHNPNNWAQIGNATKDLAMLEEILLPEGVPSGTTWEEEDKNFKIRRRAVQVGDWRDLSERTEL